MVKLFVGGFPLDTNELELVQMVSLYGAVSTIKIVRDKKTGVCKGYAFLEMEDQQGAEQAIEALDGAMLKGRELTLNITVEKPPAPVRRPFVKTDRPASSNTSNSSGTFKSKRPRI